MTTPYVWISMTSGVLQMLWLTWHLKYSRCPQGKDIWSNPDVNIKRHMEHLNLEWEKHLKYSRCNQERYIWSTPVVTRNDTYGVLQTSSGEIHLEYQKFEEESHLKYSRCLQYSDIWSTPDVIMRDTSGVIQLSSVKTHLEYSRCH